MKSIRFYAILALAIAISLGGAQSNAFALTYVGENVLVSENHVQQDVNGQWVTYRVCYGGEETSQALLELIEQGQKTRFIPKGSRWMHKVWRNGDSPFWEAVDPENLGQKHRKIPNSSKIKLNAWFYGAFRNSDGAKGYHLMRLVEDADGRITGNFFDDGELEWGRRSNDRLVIRGRVNGRLYHVDGRILDANSVIEFEYMARDKQGRAISGRWSAKKKSR